MAVSRPSRRLLILVFAWGRVGGVEFAEEFGHIEGGASGFDAAVHLVAEDAGAGLVFGVNEENHIDDGGEVADGHLLEFIADGSGDEVGVAGFAADDDAEGDDDVGVGVLEDVFGADGDFPSAGDAVEGDAGGGHEAEEFGFGGFEEAVHERLVVHAGHDGERLARADEARFAGEGLRSHKKGVRSMALREGGATRFRKFVGRGPGDERGEGVGEGN